MYSTKNKDMTQTELIDLLKLLMGNIQELTTRLNKLERLYFKTIGEPFPDTLNGSVTRGREYIIQIKDAIKILEDSTKKEQK